MTVQAKRDISKKLRVVIYLKPAGILVSQERPITSGSGLMKVKVKEV